MRDQLFKWKSKAIVDWDARFIGYTCTWISDVYQEFTNGVGRRPLKKTNPFAQAMKLCNGVSSEELVAPTDLVRFCRDLAKHCNKLANQMEGKLMSSMPRTGNEQKTVKPKVRALLTKYHWFWWGAPATMFGKSGISDNLAIKNGVFLAVESKFGRRKCTAQQIGFLNSITAEHGFGLVVNQGNLHHFETFLKHFDKATNLVASRERVEADVGAPMLDALKALTSYPKTMEEYVRGRHGLVEEDEPDEEEDIDPN